MSSNILTAGNISGYATDTSVAPGGPSPPSGPPRSATPLVSNDATEMERSMAIGSCRRLLHPALVCAAAGAAAVLSSACWRSAASAAARASQRARQPTRTSRRTPPMGWSSWSLESTTYTGGQPDRTGASWLTEAHVLQQADVHFGELKPYGYNYVNIDAGWSNGFDAYGRPVANTTTFPDGIAYVAKRRP